MDFSIRPYEPRDRSSVLALAPRISTGVAPWLNSDDGVAALVGFAKHDVDQPDSDESVVLVAQTRQGVVVGFASAEQQSHWSGQREAYVGLLAVAEDAEGNGVGRELVGSLTSWARQHGVCRVTLDTGTANRHAREFYAGLGFEEESVRLSAST